MTTATATVAAGGDPERVVATVEVTVTNTGSRHGDEVVLLFVVPPPDAVARGAPRQQLAAFTRVTLAPGEETKATLDITQRHLQVVAGGTPGAAGGEPWRVRTNQDHAGALDLYVRWE